MVLIAAAPGCVDLGSRVGPIDFAQCTEAEKVVASVKITMRSSLRSGESAVLLAEVKNASGSQSMFCLPPAEWSTSDPQVLAISGQTATALRDGVAMLKATARGFSDSATIVVSSPSVAAVAVDLPESLLVGQTARATFSARDSVGNVITGFRETVHSSDTSIATISPTAMVTARNAGIVEISIIIEGKRGSRTIAISRDAPAMRYTAISAGEQHTCGLASGLGRPEGTLLCWGEGGYGQLGNGSQARRESPEVIQTGGILFSSIEAGGFHTCALTSVGDPYCWGSNHQGEIGDGTKSIGLTVPTRVSGAVKFVKLSAGVGHTCGLTQDGLAYCWGNLSGKSDVLPTRVQNVPKLRDISSRDLMVCGISDSGDAWCWGRGDGLIVTTHYPNPTKVSSGIVFRSISSGKNHSCALTAAGAAYCWGMNATGQISSPASNAQVMQPRLLSGGFTFLNIMAGGLVTCGVTTQGARCMGATQLKSTAEERAQLSPIPREAEHPFSVMTSGGFHTCAIDDKGGVWCWGEQRFGAVGAGEWPTVDEPLQVR